MEDYLIKIADKSGINILAMKKNERQKFFAYLMILITNERNNCLDAVNSLWRDYVRINGRAPTGNGMDERAEINGYIIAGNTISELSLTPKEGN